MTSSIDTQIDISEEGIIRLNLSRKLGVRESSVHKPINEDTHCHLWDCSLRVRRKVRSKDYKQVRSVPPIGARVNEQREAFVDDDDHIVKARRDFFSLGHLT